MSRAKFRAIAVGNKKFQENIGKASNAKAVSLTVEHSPDVAENIERIQDSRALLKDTRKKLELIAGFVFESALRYFSPTLLFDLIAAFFFGPGTTFVEVLKQEELGFPAAFLSVSLTLASYPILYYIAKKISNLFERFFFIKKYSLHREEYEQLQELMKPTAVVQLEQKKYDERCKPTIEFNETASKLLRGAPLTAVLLDLYTFRPCMTQSSLLLSDCLTYYFFRRPIMFFNLVFWFEGLGLFELLHIPSTFNLTRIYQFCRGYKNLGITLREIFSNCAFSDINHGDGTRCIAFEWPDHSAIKLYNRSVSHPKKEILTVIETELKKIPGIDIININDRGFILALPEKIHPNYIRQFKNAMQAFAPSVEDVTDDEADQAPLKPAKNHIEPVPEISILSPQKAPDVFQRSISVVTETIQPSVKKSIENKPSAPAPAQAEPKLKANGHIKNTSPSSSKKDPSNHGGTPNRNNHGFGSDSVRGSNPQDVEKQRDQSTTAVTIERKQRKKYTKKLSALPLENHKDSLPKKTSVQTAANARTMKQPEQTTEDRRPKSYKTETPVLDQPPQASAAKPPRPPSSLLSQDARVSCSLPTVQAVQDIIPEVDKGSLAEDKPVVSTAAESSSPANSTLFNFLPREDVSTSHSLPATQPSIVTIPKIAVVASSSAASSSMELTPELIPTNLSLEQQARIQALIKQEDVEKIFTAVSHYQRAANQKSIIFLTGGAPRDTLASKEPRDYDFVTNLNAEELVEALLGKGYTIKVSEKMPGLVTLERRNGTKKIHLDVVCERRLTTMDDLRCDALHKDLCCNTNYVDPEGKLYAPLLNPMMSSADFMDETQHYMLRPVSSWQNVLASRNRTEEDAFHFAQYNTHRVMRIIIFLLEHGGCLCEDTQRNSFSDYAYDTFMQQNERDKIFQINKLCNLVDTAEKAENLSNILVGVNFILLPQKEELKMHLLHYYSQAQRILDKQEKKRVLNHIASDILARIAWSRTVMFVQVAQSHSNIFAGAHPSSLRQRVVNHSAAHKKTPPPTHLGLF